MEFSLPDQAFLVQNQGGSVNSCLFWLNEFNFEKDPG
jgi:hypothetical protein